MIDDRLKMVSDTVQATFKKQGQYYPMLHVFGTKKEGLVLMADFPAEHEDKLKAMLMAGYKVGHEGKLGDLESFYFISEAWSEKVTEAQKESGNYTRPSLDPNRQEILFIIGKDLVAKKTQSKIFEIVRHNKKADLKVKKSTRPDSIESPLLDAFEYGYGKGLQSYNPSAS